MAGARSIHLARTWGRVRNVAILHDRGVEDQIAKTLTWMRHKAEMSQDDLAERLSMSRVTIWNWENGATFPAGLSLLRRWASAVGARLEIKLTTKLTGKDDTDFTF